VIKSLDPRYANAPAPDAAQQLSEKDAQISQLREESLNVRQVREKEDNLMASAWYNLSAQLAKKGADERLHGLINGPGGFQDQEDGQCAMPCQGLPTSSALWVAICRPVYWPAWSWLHIGHLQIPR
jgi:hypothetical protein